MSTFGGATRFRGVGSQRFHASKPHADRVAAALPLDHPALVERRTLFPSTVVDPDDALRLLVSGKNSAKIGNRILKGPWAGMPVYTLTLEERATCPTSCDLWAECMGNAMPLARRHGHGPALERGLMEEVEHLTFRGAMVAVRLHVLGDFYSQRYANMWLEWILRFPGLHVWGYTHHDRASGIGRTLSAGNALHPDRWSIRFSVPPDGSPSPMQVTTIWREPEASNVPEGLVCPASTERSAACVTCGLCWEPDAAGKRIVFIGHGKHRTPKGPRKAREPASAADRLILAAGGAARVAAGMGLGEQAIMRWGATGHVPEPRRAAFETLCADLAGQVSRGTGVRRRG